MDAQVSQARLDRYCTCGRNAWVLRHPSDPNEYRIAANRCHDRFCPLCADERRRLVAANLQTALEQRFGHSSRASTGHRLRFLTLTLRSSTTSLSQQITRLYGCWRKLRLRRELRGAVTGGVAFLELQVGKNSGLWHPHLHVLVEGKYLPQDFVRSLWFEITGDSYVVDIRALPNIAGAIAYVVKYAGKAFSNRVWQDPERFAQAVVALQARRVFSTFGDWTSFALSKNPDDDTDWQAMCPLSELLDRAQEGDPEARRILALLANRRTLDATDETAADP